MNDKSKEKLHGSERALWMEGVVRDFLIRSPENTLANQAKDRAFEEAVVGFSRGDDPLYDAYKDLFTGHRWRFSPGLFQGSLPQPANSQ
jgi:hypothetical protein